VLEFVDQNTRQHITLTEQLTLSGMACRGGQPVAGALITLSEATGQLVRSTRTDGGGHYCMPLPEAGRYIVTMLEPDSLLAHARKVVLDVRSAVVDIDTPAAPEATAGDADRTERSESFTGIFRTAENGGNT
jgi:hypothetical protein